MVQVWQIARDGYGAQWIDRGKHLPALIRVIDGDGGLWEWTANTEGDGIDQLNRAIDRARMALQEP